DSLQFALANQTLKLKRGPSHRKPISLRILASRKEPGRPARNNFSNHRRPRLIHRRNSGCSTRDLVAGVSAAPHFSPIPNATFTPAHSSGLTSGRFRLAPTDDALTQEPHAVTTQRSSHMPAKRPGISRPANEGERKTLRQQYSGPNDPHVHFPCFFRNQAVYS